MTKENRAAHNRPARHDGTKSKPSAGYIASREASACAVYLHVAPTLIEVGDWPLVGTPAWAALDDDDPRKQAAMLYAALEWALAEDIRQNAIAQAKADAWMSGDLWGVPEQIKARKKAIADGTYIPRRSA